MAGTVAELFRMAGAGFVLAREGAFSLVDLDELPSTPRMVFGAARLIERPTAEGHAAMADAAVPAAAAVLQLDAGVPEVNSQPMAPIQGAPDAPRPPGRTGLN